MTAKDNKENIEEQIINPDTSFIDLCQRVENLPLLKEIELKTFVSLKFERMQHSYMYNTGKASKEFATYLTFISSSPKYYGNICDILLDEFVNETVIENCLKNIRAGLIPYDIWVNKLLEDIQDYSFYRKSSIGGLLTIYLGKALRASLIAFNKAVKALEDENYFDIEDVRKAVAFNKFRFFEINQEAKEDYMELFTAGTDNEQRDNKAEERRRDVFDNELSIFKETLVDMLQRPFNKEVLKLMEEKEIHPFTKFWVDPELFPGMGGQSKKVPAPIGDTGSNSSSSVGVSSATTPTDTQASDDSFMGAWHLLAGWTDEGIPPKKHKNLLKENEVENEMDEDLQEDIQQVAQEEGMQFVVEKVAKDSSSRVMSQSWFNTREEAEQFKKTLIEDSPEMAKHFDFRIKMGRRPQFGR